MKSNNTIETKKELTILYFKATNEIRNLEYNLSKNFSEPLLNKYYKTRKLSDDIKKILRDKVTQIP